MIYIPIFNLIKTKGAVLNCYFFGEVKHYPIFNLDIIYTYICISIFIMHFYLFHIFLSICLFYFILFLFFSQIIAVHPRIEFPTKDTCTAALKFG